MSQTRPGDPAADVPDFNALSETEKREVAERLLQIRQSGWKPFWCPNPTCSGDPHFELDENGEVQFEPVEAVLGPAGQPLGEVVYETPEGELYWGCPPSVEDTVVGRPVLEPAWAHNHARPDQRLPPWRKRWVLFVMSGRGAGKTRMGVEFVTLSARKGLDGAILGRRGTELVNTHVAEILAHAHPEFTPVHYASKDILVWPEVTMPDGSKRTPTTYLFSAEKPENIRSVNLSYAWVDEAAFMDEIETAWMNLKLATRVKSPGNPIHILITSTPTGTKWVMEMEDDPEVEVRRVSTYANRANLDAEFLTDLEKRYEGTRMGRQELHGEVLRDVEGALWNDSMFKHLRVGDINEYRDLIESMDNRVVAVDPAGSKKNRADETGIVAAGAQHFDEDGNRLYRSNFFVLGRATIKGSPTEWAAQAFKAAKMIEAHRIVAEKNFGGDMVKQVLTDYAALHGPDSNDYDPNTRNEAGEVFPVDVVHAVKSKETRAEATVARYEQGTVTHVTSPIVFENGTAFGDLSALEKQQTTWVPKSRGGRMPSPNDIDSLVWALNSLEATVKYESAGATSREVMAALKKSQPVSGNPVASLIPTLARRNPGTLPVRLPRHRAG